jgi:hypothetical protein
LRALLHSHLVREWPKTVPKLYEQFTKFSKSEIQHFHKLQQQRKVSNPDKAPKLRYNKNQRSYPKLVHNIDFNGCRPPENWEKNFETPPQERYLRASDQRFMQGSQRGGAPNQGRGRGRGPYIFKHPYCMYHGSETDHRTKDYPIFLESKIKMEQDFTKPSQ